MNIKKNPFGLNAKIRGFLLLFRFELPFSAGICVVLGELLALGKFPTIRLMLLGFLSVFFISATALILNDYFDIEIDKINAPERALPSGLVTGREVVVLSIVVALLGFITAYMISLGALLAGIIAWIVGFLYNWRFKRSGLIGNLMVCFSVGLTLIFGGIAVGLPFERIVWLFAVLVMLIDLGEEITADAMDIEGDRQAGSRSLAVIFGQETALKIGSAVFLLVIAISSLPFLSGWLASVYFIPLAIMDAIILYSIKNLLNPHITNRRMFARLIYLSGTAAILIFLVMRMVI